jgi:uncharacterized membrane protein
MTDSDWARSDRARIDPERLPVMLAYGLYLLAITNGLTLLVGFLIALWRRGGARGGIYESHYRNLITVFLVTVAFAGLMLALAASALLGLVSAAFVPWPGNLYGWFAIPFLFPLAWAGWVVFALWYLWRVVGGFIRALDERAA